MIVVGYSGGASGRACLEAAIVEARVRDTGVVVIHAVSGGRGQQMVEADEMADVERRLATSGLRFEIRQPIGADPSEELLNAVDEPDTQMLVIGMRRRTQVGKLLLGSTSQYLLLESPKPVLVVKPTTVIEVPDPSDDDEATPGATA